MLTIDRETLITGYDLLYSENWKDVTKIVSMEHNPKPNAQWATIRVYISHVAANYISPRINKCISQYHLVDMFNIASKSGKNGLQVFEVLDRLIDYTNDLLDVE